MGEVSKVSGAVLSPERGPVSEQSFSGILFFVVMVDVTVQALVKVVLKTGAGVFIHVDDAFLSLSIMA